MFDFESLIGFEKDKAVETLKANGYNNFKIIINSKDNKQCDSLLVVKVEKIDNEVVLTCGEFYLKLEEI